MASPLSRATGDKEGRRVLGAGVGVVVEAPRGLLRIALSACRPAIAYAWANHLWDIANRLHGLLCQAIFRSVNQDTLRAMVAQ
jgi:hypothetical protein